MVLMEIPFWTIAKANSNQCSSPWNTVFLICSPLCKIISKCLHFVPGLVAFSKNRIRLHYMAACYNRGPDSTYRWHLTSIGNPIAEIRRSYDRLISTIEFPILARWHLYIESGSCSFMSTYCIAMDLWEVSNGINSHFLDRNSLRHSWK